MGKTRSIGVFIMLELQTEHQKFKHKNV